MGPSLAEYQRLHQRYLYQSAGGVDFRTTALAAWLGVSRRTIQRWLKGATEPSEAQLRRIQAFLDDRRHQLRHRNPLD